MTAAARLDLEFIRARRIERDLSLRDVADVLGLAEAGWRRLEAGRSAASLTLAQLGALADVLVVSVTDLLTDAAPTEGGGDDASDNADLLEARVAPLLLIAGRAVPLGTLAGVLGVTTDEARRAVLRVADRLAPAGLVVSLSKDGVTLVPGRGSLKDRAVRDLLRVADLRGAVPAPAARMLHRLARGEALPQSPKRDERARLAVLLRGQWVAPGCGDKTTLAAMDVHPDVRFSLGLDEGWRCERAVATLQTAVTRRKRLPWLQDNTNPAQEA